MVFSRNTKISTTTITATKMRYSRRLHFVVVGAVFFFYFLLIYWDWIQVEMEKQVDEKLWRGEEERACDSGAVLFFFLSFLASCSNVSKSGRRGTTERERERMNHFGRVAAAAAAGWLFVEVVVEVVMRLECKCSQRERERWTDGRGNFWVEC